MKISVIMQEILSGSRDSSFASMTGDSQQIMRLRSRYIDAMEQFSTKFPLEDDIEISNLRKKMIVGGTALCDFGYVLAAESFTNDIIIRGEKNSMTFSDTAEEETSAKQIPVSGFTLIDNTAGTPPERAVHFDLSGSGYALCIKRSAAVEKLPEESAKRIADVLKEVDPDDTDNFFDSFPEIRKYLSYEELLAAVHFLGESSRALEEAEALSCGDTERFLHLVNDSGESAAMLFSGMRDSAAEFVLCRRSIGEDGAARIGDDGNIQIFLPKYLLL